MRFRRILLYVALALVMVAITIFANYATSHVPEWVVVCRKHYPWLIWCVLGLLSAVLVVLSALEASRSGDTDTQVAPRGGEQRVVVEVRTPEPPAPPAPPAPEPAKLPTASIPQPPADGDCPGPFADSRSAAAGNPRTDPSGSDAGYRGQARRRLEPGDP